VIESGFMRGETGVNKNGTGFYGNGAPHAICPNHPHHLESMMHLANYAAEAAYVTVKR